MIKSKGAIKVIALAATVAGAGLLLALKAPKAGPTNIPQARKPNIVFIMGDDLSMRDIGPFGSTQVHTPNMDRLAKEGVCLDNMYNMVPVCSPTRQSILTGLGPVRSGAYPNHTMIYNGIKTLPLYMKQLGYNAAIIGKKHYAPEASYPFDFLGGRDHDGGEGVDVDLSKAETYLKANTGKPFFLMFTSNQPHSPWTRGNQAAYNPDKIKLGPNMVDTKITRRQMAKYFAEITYLDSLIGVTLDIIKRTGQEDNTIIMFATEQGNSFPFSKWTLYDQGLHAGFITKWPGKIKAGTRNAAMLEYVDIIPTLIDIAGGDPTKINTGSKDGNGNMGFDGISFKDVLMGKSSQGHDYVYGEHTTRGINQGSDAYGSRSARDKQYLYINNFNFTEKFKNVVTGSPFFKEWRQINPARAEAYQTRAEEELYDVVNDPFNLKNLAADPKLATTKATLKAKLAAFMKQQNDKGPQTEMEALTRQPKNKEED
ncbi:sulfatase [Mucilaginibacter antarcticus]|uniref:Sulfatase n=3 Tax=Mucilaginibacter antarcticus TaxID=1855725 RepID=A0ABW5XIY4_9SPHI